MVQLDPQAAQAIEEAKNHAIEQTYLDANDAALKIKCRTSCPLRKVVITLSPPQAGKPQKENVTMPGTSPGGGKKQLECWLVDAKCEWKARVTCHD